MNVACVVLCGGLLSCSSDDFSTTDAAGKDGGGEQVLWPDSAVSKCTPGQDTDGDQIPDEVEGCKRDTDGDKFPDYNDTDADGDKIPDDVEAGSDPKQPPDSDGDKAPDFQDKDSDGDGLEDGQEDLDGNGLFGCCLKTCGEKRKGCPPPKSSTSCGPGQTCTGGSCVPSTHWLCSNGETNPKKVNTYPGTADKDLPTFVCHNPNEVGGKGLKLMQFRKSTAGAWHVALEKDSNYAEATIAKAKFLEAAAAFDLTSASRGVAGFIISAPAATTDVATLAAAISTKIRVSLPGKASISQVVSGSAKTSHDGFPTVVNTRLAVTMSSAVNPPAVRNALVPLLLSRPPADVSGLPKANFGPTAKDHIVEYQTLIRPKDKRLIVMGAVVEAKMAADATKNSGFHLDDLANGTGLATLSDGDSVECDPFEFDATPMADIIWVVDDSESMDDNRKDIVANAKDFFSRALKAGLDFRMGVAGVKSPSSSVKVGKFCSKITTDLADDGGTDRFLLPTEQKTFESCVQNPPYSEQGSEYGLAHAWEGVTRHLPRKPASAGDKSKIRKEATLVIVIASDEAPQELKSWSSYKGKWGFLGLFEYGINTCTHTKQKQIDAYVADWITLFKGKDSKHGKEAQAIVHLIGGVCKHKCGSYGPEYPWGYQEIVKATGGQIADLCQKNLGATLQKIIDSIIGAASPVVLQYVPISASIAVAINKTQYPRSLVQGFDYSSSSNSLRFYNVKLAKGDKIVVSYRRWTKQASIQ